MAAASSPYDLVGAVHYHTDRFPPANLDYARLMQPLSAAASTLARYDQMLRGMHNSELLLAPLRSQEAVVSSRIEGTISTVDEVLRYEADQDAEESPGRTASTRHEAIEVYLYSRALKSAQDAIEGGASISTWLLRAAHEQLLSFGRGGHLSPGGFKTEQNYLADRVGRKILFVPVSPEKLNEGLEHLIRFIYDEAWERLIRTALAHLEFEALHPFKDGNGRIGRMLIPLMLWQSEAISQPHFYISQYFEEHRDEYIDRMRAASASDAWTEWVLFFLDALRVQAEKNLTTAEAVRSLYENMKSVFRDRLASQWSTNAVDFVFTRPVFRSSVFVAQSSIPAATAHRFVRALVDIGLLRTLRPPAGRRSGLYSFEPLLKVIRG